MPAAIAALAGPATQLLLRQRAGVEELLHQRVVGLGDHLDQRLARASAPAPSSPSGTAPSVGLPLPSVGERHAFIATRSTTPVKLFSSPIGS